MIGDSENDFIGANEAGIDFIGVTYGFGYNTENVRRSNFIFINNPKELLGLV